VGLGAAGSALLQPGQPGQPGQTGYATEQEHEVHVVAEGSAQVAPSPAARKDETRKTLRFLATRLAVYKLESGGYPPDSKLAVQDVPYAKLRERLLKDGQVLNYSEPASTKAKSGE
jgi:hypothetical protein